jgi:hypothetical protein
VRRPNLAIALSVIQTAVTAVLTLWADRVDWLVGDSNRHPPSFVRVHLAVIDLREIWRGVNAPTIPFNFAGQKHVHVLGLSMPEILYLAAVAVLWYSIGRLYEQRKLATPANLETSRWRKRVLGVCTLAWGIILLALGVVQIPSAFPWTFAFGRILRPRALINALLYVAWSLILIGFGAVKLRASVETPPASRC